MAEERPIDRPLQRRPEPALIASARAPGDAPSGEMLRQRTVVEHLPSVLPIPAPSGLRERRRSTGAPSVVTRYGQPWVCPSQPSAGERGIAWSWPGVSGSLTGRGPGLTTQVGEP